MPAAANKATRDDVARRAGVSSAVVSYVVNDGPRPVAAATRERVLAAIKELDYRPSAAARSLRLARSHTIGLIVPDISNSFFAEFAKHLQEACHAVGYSLMLGTTGDGAMEVEQVGGLLSRDLDRIVIFGVEDLRLLDSLRRSDTPVVSMDWQGQDGTTPTIVADDYGGTVDAIRHLVQTHQHQSIGFVGGPKRSLRASTRRRAWRDTMLAACGRQPPSSWEETADFTRAGGYDATKRLLTAADISAIFVASDIQAVGVLKALNEARVAIPDTIALMSFDGTLEAEYSCPPLSVVAVPLEQMAQKALESVLVRPTESELHTMFPHSLILRASCGCGSTPPWLRLRATVRSAMGTLQSLMVRG